MILLEIGNSTIKIGHVASDGTIAVERYSNVEALLRRCEATDEPIVCAPVGARMAAEVIERLEERKPVRVIGREDVAAFVGDSYDTPETLGLDRVLNLMGLGEDGIVISCGTAITVDAWAAGKPMWGAIMPGFRTAADGLHERIAVLPVASLAATPRLPARTSDESVTNGVLLATAFGAQGIAGELAWQAFDGLSPRTLLTGGDAGLLARLWHGQPPEIDDALLFRGMMNVAE